MTGGEAVAAALAAHGVDTVFGIPGAHNLSLYDALIEAPVRHVLARHEQGAAFMADGYARACGRPGVCVVTSGPAALNTITPLGTAYSDSSPVLCIASQIPAAGIGREKGYLHECSDQLACFRPVTGWCGRADSVAAIPGLLREAFAGMSGGRPRPAALEIPCDVLDASGEAEIGGPVRVERLQPGSAQIEAAAAALRAAASPVAWAGGGVIASGAGGELRELAETLQARCSPRCWARERSRRTTRWPPAPPSCTPWRRSSWPAGTPCSPSAPDSPKRRLSAGGCASPKP